jgi:hypothetical protein
MIKDNFLSKKKVLPTPSSGDSFLPQINPRHEVIKEESSESQYEGTSRGSSKADIE